MPQFRAGILYATCLNIYRIESTLFYFYSFRSFYLFFFYIRAILITLNIKSNGVERNHVSFMLAVESLRLQSRIREV
jgi:hypothetical protein